MYSDKAHVNYLTRILLNQGITDIVVCPGARNAPLCHNFHQAGFTLHPVTDERSAAFVALGIYLETRRPTLVCVTSGSALLNTLPAVAEAFYRHIPLVVVSADRPEEWIGQLDGQTIPQKGTLQPYAKCINIAEEKPLEGLAIRIAEELSMPRPLHINVELEEPLFNFTVEELPQVEKVEFTENNPLFEFTEADLQTVANAINEAKFPLLMMGQIEEPIHTLANDLRCCMAIHPEILSNTSWYTQVSSQLEKCLAAGVQPPIIPDLIIHVGGPFICKQMKLFLRKQPGIRVIRIGLEEEPPKTFGRVDFAVRTHPVAFLNELVPLLNYNYDSFTDWANLIEREYNKIEDQTNLLKEVWPLTRFDPPRLGAMHVANSSSVRMANIVGPWQYSLTYCNRGVNGIEGSLSVAAGQSLKTDMTIGCIIGDLSFFYDSNALWNTRLGKNLVVLLLNDGGGKIFHKLNKLKDSPALDEYIAAHHGATAEGICASYNINYVCKVSGQDNLSELNTIVNNHLESEATRPLVIEILLKLNN